MKEYLVVCRDGPFDEAHVVLAPSEDEARTKYLEQVIATGDLHREVVRDVSVNMGFAARFYLASEEEHENLMATGECDTEPEVVSSRVRTFFSDRPDLGEIYLRYLDTEDAALLSDELFKFAALHMDPSELGLLVIPLKSLPLIK